MTAYDPAVRTRTVARIVGPYLVLMAVALFARQGELELLLPAFMQDAPLVLATGAFTLMAGHRCPRMRTNVSPTPSG